MLMIELVLLLLFVKHYLFDFVWQTSYMLRYKGEYGDIRGVAHSIGHGLGTSLVVLLFLGPWWAVILGSVDGILHYHIDWVKANFGNKNINDPAYWNHHGLDQLAHSLTYVFLAGFILRNI